MPATERLLRKLEETLGDELTRDLVTWVEGVRSVNRAEVREIADLYLARLDERLERRLAEFEARLKADLKADLAEFQAEFRAELKTDITALRVETKADLAALRVEMSDRHRDVVRWLFIFWAGTFVPLAGLFLALERL